MSLEKTSAPISDATLAEHWFSLRNKTWRKVAALVRSSGLEQRAIADRIGMDPGQFSRVLSGSKANVTLRTLHNIARAVDHRLEVNLIPLSSLRAPNYSYYSARAENSNMPTQAQGWAVAEATSTVSKAREFEAADAHV